MANATMTSVAEYLATSYRPDREYVDGLILERNVGEWDHSRLQMRIAAFLYGHEAEWGITVVPEQRVQVSQERFRVPDVTVLAGSHTGEQILTRAPFVCIEILSKDDRMSEMQERISDYLAFGVAHVWVIDPRTRRCFEYTSGGMRTITEGALTTSSPAITLPLSECF